ncbi:ester cyclase [Pseudomonas sp. NPDC007930]|uniref:ester cyclase n=1 Tax=Pseudomonas sp. NPDC007930 TaxID=3364417 RepID=UPI0036EA9266
MTPAQLSAQYLAYIACLNAQDWPNLGQFVDDSVRHNGTWLGVAGYQAMLEHDYRTIPDLRFNVGLLVAEPPVVAARLLFDCSPQGPFLGLDTTGRRVQFSEHVFYTFAAGKITEVHSLLDKTALEQALAAPG